MTEEDTCSWNIVYPCYIDKSKSCSGGRKVAAQYTVDNPTVDEIKLVCDRLELKCLIEREKSHPKDWPPKGRVRVYLPSNTNTSNSQVITKLQLLRKVGSMIPMLKSRQELPSTSKTKPLIAGVGEPTLSKSHKGKKGKK